MKDLLQDKPIVLVVVTIFMMVLLLSACATEVGPTQPASVEPGTVADETATATLPKEGEIVGDVVPMVSPVPEEPASAVPSPLPAVQPTPRLDLHATDPSGVTLAAGKPQLIEFFAFW
jgi:hypothetical protein